MAKFYPAGLSQRFEPFVGLSVADLAQVGKQSTIVLPLGAPRTLLNPPASQNAKLAVLKDAMGSLAAPSCRHGGGALTPVVQVNLVD